MKQWGHYYVVSCLVLLKQVFPSTGARVSVEVVNASRFELTVSVDGVEWLRTEDILMGSSKMSDGSLALDALLNVSSGTDQLGAFTKTTMTATTRLGDRVLLSAIDYDDSNYVAFEQKFPQGLQAEDTELSALTAFPAFARRTPKRFFSYHGVFPQPKSGESLEEYQESHQGGLPVVAYDAENAVVFSSLDHHKAQHAASDITWWGAGLKAGISAVPDGWTQRWIVAAAAQSTNDESRDRDEVIRPAMAAWGAALLTYHGVSNDFRANRYRDVVHGGVGFWTDNGGYYHYSTGSSNNETYEDVLPRVKKSHDDANVPIRHWQFDSWFYPKDGAVSSGGGGGAVTNWTALSNVFPSGMKGINEKLDGMPMVMHNRQWSPISDYLLQNVPPGVEWLTTGAAPDGAAVPRDPDTSFDWFFKQQEQWGLWMYEQDWMSAEYDKVDALTQNLTLADSWLRAMAKGVAASNRTQQYCMPYVHDVLTAAHLPAVTNARASNDYFHDKAEHVENWNIGGTALLYASLGILPFKDGFYSSNLRQVGGQNEGPELSPDREAIVATLSAAMVAPMDGLGYLNATRVKATCRADGYVLKPDQPLRLAEWCFVDNHGQLKDAPENCTVYDAATDAIDGISPDVVSYVYLDQPSQVFPPAFVSGRRVLYNWYTGAVLGPENEDDDDDVVVDPGYENHSFAVSTPVLDHDWAFLGELDKYCTASSFRFSAVAPLSDDACQVTATGVQNETISVCAAHFDDDLENNDGVWTLYCAETTFKDTDVPVDLTILRTPDRISRSAKGDLQEPGEIVVPL